MNCRLLQRTDHKFSIHQALAKLIENIKHPYLLQPNYLSNLEMSYFFKKS